MGKTFTKTLLNTGLVLLIVVLLIMIKGGFDKAAEGETVNDDNSTYAEPFIITQVVTGNPNPELITNNHVERHNRTMRMGMRRFTRKTDAFSKKLENHAYMVAVFMMYYNFVRIHKTLRVTPAMEAGVTDRLWSLEDMIELTEWKFEIR